MANTLYRRLVDLPGDLEEGGQVVDAAVSVDVQPGTRPRLSLVADGPGAGPTTVSAALDAEEARALAEALLEVGEQS